MADKYINEVGVIAIRNWAEGKFALDSDLDTLAEEVQELITEGGEPNTIETISVNGTNVPPDAQKNVDLTVPTATSDLTNDGDGSSNFATEAYVWLNGGKIDTISVNNTPQTITNKNVNITVPTAVSALTNDSGYQTSSDVATTLANNGNPYQTQTDVSSAISSSISSAYKYKGSVANQAALPSSGQNVGDVYDTQDTGMNYAWNGSAWDSLGTYVDTSVLWSNVSGQTNSLIAMTTAEVNAILNPSA